MQMIPRQITSGWIRPNSSQQPGTALTCRKLVSEFRSWKVPMAAISFSLIKGRVCPRLVDF